MCLIGSVLHFPFSKHIAVNTSLGRKPSLQVKLSIESTTVELYLIVTLLLFIPTGGPQSTLHVCIMCVKQYSIRNNSH